MTARCMATVLIAWLVLAPIHGSQPDPIPETPTSVSEERRLDHDGIERSYRIHVPDSYDDAISTPLVMAFHGGRGTGRSMEKLTGLSVLADTEGFIVVYPDGYERQWNDGRNIDRYASHRENIDDVGFISSLIDHLGQSWNIDADRVYLTGMSNGALFCHRLACENPDRIAAIAPVEGTILERWTRECQPSRPIPVCIIKGLEAPLFEKESKRLSASETAQFWASHNGCSPTPNVDYEADTDPDDGTRVRREVYECGSSAREVVFYAIEGGGHTWPGGWQYYPEDVIGRTSRDIDATRLIWEFFARHRRPGTQGGAIALERASEIQAQLPPRPEVVGDYKPNCVVTGDWNGDGHLDFAAAHAFRDRVSVFLGDGTGRFEQRATVAVARRPIGMTRGDWNADGHGDLAVTSYNRAGLAVLLGDGHGEFRVCGFAETGNSPQAATAGDWNADGRTDAAVSNRNDHTVSVLLNTGSVRFAPAAAQVVGRFPSGLVAGDWNGDGNQDLAVVNHFSHTVSILLGDGTGRLRSLTEVDVGLYPGDIDTADLDRDGRADLVVVNVRNGDLSVLHGRGDGRFETQPRLDAGLAPAGIVVDDLDGDAAPDVAVVMRDEPRLVVFRNRLADEGRFVPAGEVATGELPIDVVSGDFDEDGRRDLLVFTPSNAGFLVFLNRTQGAVAR
jgi:polyhydroxybutyrate depolymerase